MQIGASVFNIQSVYQIQQNESAQKQSTSGSVSGVDTVNISPEARFFYEQSLMQEQQNAEAQVKVRETEQAMAVIEDTKSTEEDTAKATRDEFRNVLHNHRGNNSGRSSAVGTAEDSGSLDASSIDSADGSSVDGSDGGSGGSSGGSSSNEDAIKDLEDRIKQVTSELSSVASTAVKNDDSNANARVEQLQMELEQLQSQLAALESESGSEA